MNNPVRTSQCDLCLMENIEEYERDYFNKTRTVGEIVDAIKNEEKVKCHKIMFYNHMRYHVKPEVQIMMSKSAPMLANDLVDKMGEMIEEIDRIKDKIGLVAEKVHGGSDPALIKAYIGLEAELRKSVESLAKLSGDIKGSERVYVKNLTVEYNNVIGQVLQDACPVCKEKFARTLEPRLTKSA